MIKYLCSKSFDLMGWKFVNNIPKDLKKYVLIGVPHTSNWDFWLAMTFFHKANLKGKFTIKKQWLFFSLGFIFKKMGAIGIDREAISKGKRLSLTDQISQLIKQSDKFTLLITPEGTRKPVDKWKTGFYHIAKKAEVPIVLAYGDYKNKELGASRIIYPSDIDEDMKEIKKFYKTINPKLSNNFYKEWSY